MLLLLLFKYINLVIYCFSLCLLPFVVNHTTFRSLFIWRPKEKSEPVEQKDERRIIVCGRAEKKRSRKFGDESDDDSDVDKFTSKSTKMKSNKPERNLTRCPNKVKR